MVNQRAGPPLRKLRVPALFDTARCACQLPWRHSNRSAFHQVLRHDKSPDAAHFDFAPIGAILDDRHSGAGSEFTWDGGVRLVRELFFAMAAYAVAAGADPVAVA